MRSTATSKTEQKRSGVAAVEMAFVFPLFMLMVLGIVEFGRYMMVGQLVTNSAREGARMAISGYFTEDEVRADIEAFVTESVGIESEQVVIEIETESGNTLDDAEAKELITVTVALRFVDVTFLPFLGEEAPSGGEDYLYGLRDTQDETKWITGLSSMRKE